MANMKMTNAFLGEWQPIERRKNMVEQQLRIRPNFLTEVPSFIRELADFDRHKGTSLAAGTANMIELMCTAVIACDLDSSDKETEVVASYILTI